MKRNPIILISCPAYQRTPMLKFANGRDYCREQLRQVAQKTALKVLYYTITLDRFILLVHVRNFDLVGAFSRKVKVLVASHYRQAKHREGPFWKPRNPITLIQPDQVIADCIRAMTEVIPYTQACRPEQWPHCGYHEIIGARKRYRLIDMAALNAVAGTTTEELQQLVLETTNPKNNPIQPWTEATAVGSREWINRAAQPIAGTRYSTCPLPPSWQALHTAKNRRRQHIKAILKVLAKQPR